MFTVTTISHKTADSQHPLLMLTNREGYKIFFGKIPEGTQRILNENRVRLGKLRGIFLTGRISTWSEIGGLPGLFLTISDSTKKDIDIFSGSGKLMSFILATWRYFVFRKGVKLNIVEAEEDKIIADSVVAVIPIKVKSNATDVPEADDSVSDKIFTQLKKLTSMMFPLDTSKANDPDPYSYKSDPSENEAQTHVKLVDPMKLFPTKQQSAISYLVRPLPFRGKFDPAKAKALGIKPGVDFRRLTQGEHVKNEKGETVIPEQVMEKSKSFPRLLILDIPDNSYVDNVINCNAIFEKTEDKGNEDIGLVYHLLGDEVDFKSESYIKFINKFPADCKHVISHSSLSNNTLVFNSAVINLLKLRSVHKECYNLPFFENYEPLSEPNIEKLQQLQDFNISSSGVSYNDSPIERATLSDLFDEHIAPNFSGSVDKEEFMNDPSASLEPNGDNLKDLVQLITLGTGSALPSTTRNVISTLVRIPFAGSKGIEFRSILLDGGENTLGSIIRNFGHDEERLNQIMKELQLLHLSHLHADHHLGIISVINKWFEVNGDNDNKLYLVSPWQYNNFLQEWYSVEKQISPNVDMSRLVYISNEEFVGDRQPEYQQTDLQSFEDKFDSDNLSTVIPKMPLRARNNEAINSLRSDLGIESITTVRAIHCYWSYSIAIKFRLDSEKSFKISYSGDTRPNPRFVDAGIDSDVLIHESTLDNVQIEEAISKKHSTMVEAINVCRYMNCPKLILTHFSTRYTDQSSIASISNLTQLSSDLQAYLSKYGSTPNIFNLESKSRRMKNFNELKICFGFDSMFVSYKNIDDQMLKYEAIVSVLSSGSDSGDNLSEKKEKELKKQNEKREAKRIQRLAMKGRFKKKRRQTMDPEEIVQSR